MNRRTRAALLALVPIFAAFWLRRAPSPPPTATSGQTTQSAAERGTPITAPAASSVPTPNGKGFKNADRLAEHFAKHGGEFGAASATAYLALAQQLRDAPAGGNVLEVVRPLDGVVSRFDRASGAFIAFDRDGTIRTFFKPNDGEDYFRRQAKRMPR